MKTREEWLGALVKALRPKFKAAGLPIPAKIGATCGWPSEGALKARIGEYWNASASEAGRHEIFISPVLADNARVAATLVHELAHAALPENVTHGREFAAAMKALGLIGKPTATEAGAELTRELEAITKKLGRYPHSKIKHGVRRTKKQTTRLLKAACPDCGYTIRVTAKWADVGLPTCPCGGQIALDGATVEDEEAA